jgi:hypothetical protein
MEQKEYFKKLVSLYEAEKEIQDPGLDQVADSGTDLQADDGLQDAPQPQDEQIPEESTPEEGLDDADYLSQSNQPQQPLPPEPAEIHKAIRLFDLYSKLLDYVKTFHESLDVIDSNLLDKVDHIEMVNKKEKIEKVVEKLDYYMKEIFPVEKYEKSLYVYVLLRTEIITMIKSLRELLKLDQTDEKDKKKD